MNSVTVEQTIAKNLGNKNANRVTAKRTAVEKQRAAVRETERITARPYTPQFGDALIVDEIYYELVETINYGSRPMWSPLDEYVGTISTSEFQGYTRQYYDRSLDYAEWIPRVPVFGDELVHNGEYIWLDDRTMREKHWDGWIDRLDGVRVWASKKRSSDGIIVVPEMLIQIGLGDRDNAVWRFRPDA